jgi:diguanylate cyclase (GGDEF)-like protein
MTAAPVRLAAPRRGVLIVDDQPANVRVLAETLRDRYELYFATSGPAALARAAAGGIDLVLLDVEMPGMDGFSVCRALKADERTRDVPVIFVTALDEIADEARGFEAGGVDYITKPISPAIVVARVRTHVELKEARDLLAQMALVDALTGVANRRRFDACLEHEWRRAARGRHALSVALLDIDHFKAFNDRYGHAQGDQCLAAVARALAAACRRPADLVARYGGEEFAIVLPDTEREGACALGVRALGRVRDLGILHEASPSAGHVMVSLGMVSLVPRDDQDPRDALQKADALLYQAKAAGRGQGIHRDLGSEVTSTITLAGAENGGSS